MLPLPPSTKALMLACIGFFCLGILAPDVKGWLALWPLASGYFMPWQMLTYALMHGDFGHLFFNMLGLYMFGAQVEQYLGQRRFWVLIVVSVLTAAVVQLVVTFATQSLWPTVGISGGVFGLLLVMGLVFGDQVVVPLIPPIPMKMKVLVMLYGGIELLLGVTGRTGVAHFAHLGGMLGAYLLMLYWRRPNKRPPHLRRVH
jgi:membrane associated rhomboid family serine protease